VADQDDRRRRLAAILSADVAGYSRLMGQDEDATITALNACRAIFRDRIEAHRGRVVDTAGDSVLAVFDSVVEAVQCANEVQAELGTRDQDLPDDRQMLFRVGVNLGDVIEQDDGTIYGDGVNVAARLESLAEPGGICLSGSAHEQVEGKTDLGFQDIGEHDVKNIARPVHAYRVVLDAQVGSVPPGRVQAPPDKPSIAVLPFANLSGDPEQEYFADGISEDLITAFSGMRWLLVIARHSTFSYKGRSPDVRDVGRELGVRYVLEGSVRKGGDRIRITAQLIDAADGTHVCAHRYDRKLADIFDLQDEITLAIAGAIEPELAQIERERARREPPDNLDAWDLCQRGLWHFWQFNKDDNAEARRLFRRAIEIDPRFAAAHANLSYTHYVDTVFAYADSPQQSIALAQAAAKQAIAIDDKDATAHCVLGRALTAGGLHSAAIDELRAALDLNPSFAQAHQGLGVALCFDGQAAEAVTEFEAARRLSPHDPYFWAFEAVGAAPHISLGQFQEAARLCRSALRRPGVGFWAYANLASALGNLGHGDEARSMLAKTLELNPDFSREWFDRVWLNVDSSHTTPYFEGLRKAGLDNAGGPAADPLSR
jgi:TolB-like protein/class 3 adenylate cyclase